MKKIARFSLALILTTALLPANLFGQTATTTKISGLVTDAQGAASQAWIPAPTQPSGEVTVANPNATFGRSGGGQINLVTKRGSNLFHGSLYEYHQNDALNANLWTNNRLGLPKPAVRDNRFGGTISQRQALFLLQLRGEAAARRCTSHAHSAH
jgi:hypothetical protein